jgi:hypothetical protein
MTQQATSFFVISSILWRSVMTELSKMTELTKILPINPAPVSAQLSA